MADKPWREVHSETIADQCGSTSREREHLFVQCSCSLDLQHGMNLFVQCSCSLDLQHRMNLTPFHSLRCGVESCSAACPWHCLPCASLEDSLCGRLLQARHHMQNADTPICRRLRKSISRNLKANIATAEIDDEAHSVI